MKTGDTRLFGDAGTSVADVRLRRGLIALVLAIACLAGMAAKAKAANSPAWKVIAATGPTNLPPVQSEIQRVTVQAEGGTFKLGIGVGEAKIMDKAYFGTLSATEGSTVATIDGVEGAGASFEVGARVVGGGLPFEGETFVESCSLDCVTPGSTVTFSQPAAETTSGEIAIIYSKEAVVEEGALPVGAEVVGKEAGKFAPGTIVTSVNGTTITLSRPPASEYFLEEVVSVTGFLTTGPIAYDASKAELQAAFDAVPAFSGGGISVTGGPGGTAAGPFFLAFGGTFADQNVPAITADESNLVGPQHVVSVFTVVPGGPGTGQITINPANIGGAASSGPVALSFGPLPPGVTLSGAPVSGGGGKAWTCTGTAGDSSFSCTFAGSVGALETIPSVQVPVVVHPGAAATSSVPVEVSGGGGGSDTFQMPIVVSVEPATAGTQAFWAGAFDGEGKKATQAGAHAFSAQTYFILNTVRAGSGQLVPAGTSKDVIVDLPPGFIGNPLATKRCPQTQLVPPPEGGNSELCSDEQIVGNFAPLIEHFGETSPQFNTPIWNDVPAQGYAAEFTTRVVFPVQNILASVRSSEDYGVRIEAPNNPNFYKIYGAYAALEGEPAAANGKAFLANPTDCAEEARRAPTTAFQWDTWENAGVFSQPAVEQLPSVTGCDKLEFTPSLGFQPSTTQGSSGAGATATLRIPQESLLEPTKLAQPPLKKAVVSLPAGLTLNPSSANGLEACSESQMGLLQTDGELPNPIRFDENAPACPDGSKLGTVRVKTPLLEEEIGGTIYLAEQDKNPFGSLLALYLAIESPRFGLQIKLAGKVDLDPTTGQLTATFDYSPQVPFEELKLNFRGGGPRSELATPEVCGHYVTTGSLEPWSAPESGPPAQIQEGGFDIGGNCAASPERRPFAPSFEAGTTGTQAGAYSPLVIKVSRNDGEQELKTLDFTLPKGLLGKLAGIPYCQESAIQEAERKSGLAERASSSCPAASRIGSVDTAAGVGSEPFHVAGSVYLAGPYKGAPLSSVVITPAVAGPFDLGDVVVRAPLYVNPETAEITAKSDPIPTILKGIPLKVRSVGINLDRPTFALNPTSCNVMLAKASISGSSGATSEPSNRFQVGGCKQLKFKPNLKISLRGATKRTGLPALKAVLTYPKHGAYANIARAQVNLPHSVFLEQGNLDKTCTKPVLLEGKCSKRTIYGKAKAWTPLLDKPIEGPVYLVGGYGFKLPALVAELNGQIRVLLKGKVDSGPNGGIRNTFEAVPDAPVSRFVLELKGGKKYGLLVNSESLCKRKQRANARFTAQNGLVDQVKPVIANQCGKKRKRPETTKPKQKG